MAEPSNTLIYQTLLEQNKQLGRIEANVESATKAFDAHVQDDKLMEKRIGRLETSNSRIKGGVTVMSLLVSGIVNIAGWYFGRH